MVDFLTRPEIDALLASPDQATGLGRRDHAFWLTVVQTGLRLSEMIAWIHEDVSFGVGAHIRCYGKGRKERSIPLAKRTAAVLKAWIREQDGAGSNVLFPSSRGGRLSAVGVQHMVARYAARQLQRVPRCETNAYHPMCCVTPPQWSYCRPESIVR